MKYFPEGKSCKDFRRWVQALGNNRIRYISGLKADKEGYYHAHIGYNNFEDKLTKIPKNAKIKRISKERREKYYCGDLLTLDDIKPEVKNKHKGYKIAMVHDNGGRPFKVYYTKEKAFVYRIPEDVVINHKDDPYNYYTQLVAKYNLDKIWVPRGIGAYEGVDPFFDGNSLLLRLKNGRYVFVGDNIYKFSPIAGDRIKKYHSLVGNNDVPYPVAVGEKYVYFMLDKVAVPMKYFENFSESEFIDAYMYFYGHTGPEALSKYSVPMKNVCQVQERTW